MAEPMEDVAGRFRELQQGLAAQWPLLSGFNQEEHTMVVLPSLSLDFDAPASVHQAYEERFLFLLLLLKKPRARVVYVTSQPIAPDLVDYYLSLLPGVIPSHARKRLTCLALGDASLRPLTRKILDRPRVIDAIRRLAGDPARAHLVPYNTTEMERELAVRLGLPMYGCDPAYFHLGTKTGCRRLFAEEGVSHPRGEGGLRTLDELAAALQRLRVKAPELAQAVVKHDDGVSGMGNAFVDLRGLPPSGAFSELQAIKERLRALRFESAQQTLDGYLAKLEREGGVVEERIVGEEFRSPSVQMRVTPLGQVEVLSTHDQLLGGPEGQSYLGCRFPAEQAYASAITREARKLGERLAREGVLGRFAVDFVVVRAAGSEWVPYAIELNLRKGGTTHPYLTLEFLTGGQYDANTGAYLTPSGRRKYYVASDHVESPLYRALTPDDLFDFAVRSGLHFNPLSQTGIVFHMAHAVTEHGSFGLTAVGNTADQADALYRQAAEGLLAEGKAALGQA